MDKIALLNEQETVLLGAKLWHLLPPDCLLFLSGGLGAGKTTLMRGLLRSAGHKTAVKSPTYTLVEEYELPATKLYHFDLYRVRGAEELEWIGMQDYLAEPSLCCIEWPENGKGFLPTPDLTITLSTTANGRLAQISKSARLMGANLKLHWKNKDIVL